MAQWRPESRVCVHAWGGGELMSDAPFFRTLSTTQTDLGTPQSHTYDIASHTDPGTADKAVRGQSQDWALRVAEA